MIDYTLSYLINRNLRVHFDLTDVHALTGTLTISSNVKQEYVFFFPPRIFPHRYKGVLLSQCIAVCVNRGSELKKQREIDHNYQNSKNFFCCTILKQRWILQSSACSSSPASTCVHHIVSKNPFSYSSFLFFILIFTVLYLPVAG